MIRFDPFDSVSVLHRSREALRGFPDSLYNVLVTIESRYVPEDEGVDDRRLPSDGPRTSDSAAGGHARDRRHLLEVAALTTATGLLGMGAGAEVTRWRDTHLSPTSRTAPRPSAPGQALGARVVFQTEGETGKLALTFDDGPDPRWTPLVLDMLTRLRVRATFFVLGSAAESHPELIAREADEGHEVAVHNWVHTDVYGVDFPELTGSVRRTCEAITAAGAPPPNLWRPPYGRVDAPAMMVAAQQGLDVLLWSVHTPSAAKAAAVKDVAGAGSVILCHDGRTQPSEDLFTALEGSIRSLLERGLTVTTGSDLLTSDRAASLGTTSEPSA